MEVEPSAWSGRDFPPDFTHGAALPLWPRCHGLFMSIPALGPQVRYGTYVDRELYFGLQFLYINKKNQILQR